MSPLARLRAFITRWRVRLAFLRLEIRARLETLESLTGVLTTLPKEGGQAPPLVVVGDEASAAYLHLMALSPRIARVEIRVVEDADTLARALDRAVREGRRLVIAGDLYARHHAAIGPDPARRGCLVA